MKNIKFLKSLLVLQIISLFLSACDGGDNDQKHDLNDKIVNPGLHIIHKHKEQENVYRFGFDLRSTPQEDARQYLPFLKYLEKETGYKFKLHFSSAKRDISDDIGGNHVDFAAIGAVSFIQSNKANAVIPMARGLNVEKKAEYRSMLVVANNSPIKSVSHLSNKQFAFGSLTSTQGHLIPRIMLEKAGLTLNDLAGHIYTGSHQACANAVISGKADVCGMQDTMAFKMAKNGLLKIIHKSSYYPSSGIVAASTVPEEVREKVKLALLNFAPRGKDRAGLYNWDKTEMPLGFAKATVSDYEDLKNWAIHFKFISEK